MYSPLTREFRLYLTEIRQYFLHAKGTQASYIKDYTLMNSQTPKAYTDMLICHHKVAKGVGGPLKSEREILFSIGGADE